MTIRRLTAKGARTLLCSLLAALWLSACVNGQAGDQGLEQAAWRANPVEMVKLPVAGAPAAGSPGDTTISHGAKQTRRVSLPEPPPNPPPRPVPDLQTLVGMNRDGLSGLLGKPTLWRREPPAEVWQYSAAKCVLHVFLYSDAAAGGYLVSHVDVIRRQRRAIPAEGSSGGSLQQDCFGRVLHRATAQNQASTGY